MMKRMLLLLTIVLSSCAGKKAHQQEFTQYNVPYGSHPQQKMDIHLPEKAGPHPVMMMIHGGGWHWGDKENRDQAARQYCKNGFAVFNINYRLGENSSFFTMDDKLDDIERALNYVYDYKEEWELGETLTLSGGSAGGHLSLLYGYGRGREIVDAVVSYSGPTDLLNPEYISNGIREHIDNCFPADIAEDREELYRNYSPLYMVDKDLPATLLIHGTSDKTVPENDSRRLAKALEEFGVQVTYIPVEGVDHDMIGTDWDAVGAEIWKFISMYSR